MTCTYNNSHLLPPALWGLSLPLSSVWNSSSWWCSEDWIWKLCFTVLSDQKLLYLVPQAVTTNTCLGLVSVFSWPPNGIWAALWSGQKLGFKGARARAEKGGSQGEILPPNKEEPAYRQSCPEMEGASSNCGVSGLWRKPCKQRKLQLPVAGALPEDCWQPGSWDSTTATWAGMDSRRPELGQSKHYCSRIPHSRPG